MKKIRGFSVQDYSTSNTKCLEMLTFWQHDPAVSTGSDERSRGLQPFAVLDEAPVSLQGKSVMKLAAPSLLNDYYTSVLDCSCNGLVALALGSSVYLWNSETRALVGHLDPGPQTGRPRHRSVSSLCWSRDGTALCVGTRRGEIQLWDVENEQNMSCLPSHLSVVGALSWKQQLLSSGSVLGRIHHLDPRAPAPLVGAAVQTGGICSLQWSPGDDWLASGSADGLLRIWDSDIAGLTRSKQPVTTMKQPSAVKTTPNDSNCRSVLCDGLKRRVHSRRVLHLALNHDGSQIFSAGVDQRLHVWDR
ncbi:hypothetical protein F2P81_014269 [Scophthalmus maximus]|uniref:Anaphase-promoting complex subunit 4-like WD40 domain-containing protein n=1 Tax=Scophthalmus maximus TaxID=52904 RepID=A0A6A4SJB3_SCOMX|nr:hypothetical protein F2P81_014269 [Scophthalmus maximus]